MSLDNVNKVIKAIKSDAVLDVGLVPLISADSAKAVRILLREAPFSITFTDPQLNNGEILEDFEIEAIRARALKELGDRLLAKNPTEEVLLGIIKGTHAYIGNAFNTPDATYQKKQIQQAAIMQLAMARIKNTDPKDWHDKIFLDSKIFEGMSLDPNRLLEMLGGFNVDQLYECAADKRQAKDNSKSIKTVKNIIASLEENALDQNILRGISESLNSEALCAYLKTHAHLFDGTPSAGDIDALTPLQLIEIQKTAIYQYVSNSIEKGNKDEWNKILKGGAHVKKLSYEDKTKAVVELQGAPQCFAKLYPEINPVITRLQRKALRALIKKSIDESLTANTAAFKAGALKTFAEGNLEQMKAVLSGADKALFGNVEDYIYLLKESDLNHLNKYAQGKVADSPDKIPEKDFEFSTYVTAVSLVNFLGDSGFSANRKEELLSIETFKDFAKALELIAPKADNITDEINALTVDAAKFKEAKAALALDYLLLHTDVNDKYDAIAKVKTLADAKLLIQSIKPQDKDSPFDVKKIITDLEVKEIIFQALVRTLGPRLSSYETIKDKPELPGVIKDIVTITTQLINGTYVFNDGELTKAKEAIATFLKLTGFSETSMIAALDNRSDFGKITHLCGMIDSVIPLDARPKIEPKKEEPKVEPPKKPASLLELFKSIKDDEIQKFGDKDQLAALINKDKKSDFVAALNRIGVRTGEQAFNSSELMTAMKDLKTTDPGIEALIADLKSDLTLKYLLKHENILKNDKITSDIAKAKITSPGSDIRSHEASVISQIRTAILSMVVGDRYASSLTDRDMKDLYFAVIKDKLQKALQYSSAIEDYNPAEISKVVASIKTFLDPPARRSAADEVKAINDATTQIALLLSLRKQEIDRNGFKVIFSRASDKEKIKELCQTIKAAIAETDEWVKGLFKKIKDSKATNEFLIAEFINQNEKALANSELFKRDHANDKKLLLTEEHFKQIRSAVAIKLVLRAIENNKEAKDQIAKAKDTEELKKAVKAALETGAAKIGKDKDNKILQDILAIISVQDLLALKTQMAAKPSPAADDKSKSKPANDLWQQRTERLKKKYKEETKLEPSKDYVSNAELTFKQGNIHLDEFKEIVHAAFPAAAPMLKKENFKEEVKSGQTVHYVDIPEVGRFTRTQENPTTANYQLKCPPGKSMKADELCANFAKGLKEEYLIRMEVEGVDANIEDYLKKHPINLEKIVLENSKVDAEAVCKKALEAVGFIVYLPKVDKASTLSVTATSGTAPADPAATPGATHTRTPT